MKDITNDRIQEGIYLDKQGFAYKVFYTGEDPRYISTEQAHNLPSILTPELASQLFRIENPARLEALLARANRISSASIPKTFSTPIKRDNPVLRSSVIKRY